MAEPLLQVRGLVKRFGGLVATDRVDFDVAPGEVHAVIGPNGAGKTTLVSQLAGELAPDAGLIRFDGHDITRLPVHRRALRGLARSFQVTSVLKGFTARDNVALAVQAQAGHSFRFWRDARRDPALTGPAAAALERVGLAAAADTPAERLSYGQQRQLELAMALAGGPKLLLLDEPMAGMGGGDSARIVALLRGLKGSLAIVLVEHDMDAVFQLADRITVLVEGRAVASGPPEAIRADPVVRRAYLGEDAA
ncbi:MAG TPA: ABC transporter ATP-binding protein [Alphaproteobacteria bacterium]|nr:ABC transporter ATP-binding protein [Alphaproteobacteria bacterium]